MGIQIEYEQVVAVLFPDRASHWYGISLNNLHHLY